MAEGVRLGVGVGGGVSVLDTVSDCDGVKLTLVVGWIDLVGVGGGVMVSVSLAEALGVADGVWVGGGVTVSLGVWEPLVVMLCDRL